MRTGFQERWLMPHGCQCLRHLDEDLSYILCLLIGSGQAVAFYDL